MIRVSNVKVPYNKDESEIEYQLLKILKIKKKELISYEIEKMSIDARKKEKITKVYTVKVSLQDESNFSHLEISNNKTYIYPENIHGIQLENRPVVVGTGPSGIFAAYLLAEMGYNPLIFERGEKIEKRTQTVRNFWENGILNTESNVQFGEGGAGTFSDGKLTTRIKDDRINRILDVFIDNGAPIDISYKNKPHLGTDNLRKIMINMRKQIIELGGTFQFNSKMTDLLIEENQIKGVVINNSERIASDVVILAIGNSARDTFEMLLEKNVPMEAKPFAVGFRIEHKQADINVSQYGDSDIATYLGAAEYKLTYKASNGRSVYSFCMCPGGQVVASASEINRLTVNGMSEYKRNKENANSAIIVNVNPDDFEGENILKGMDFQREIEEKAYFLGGGSYAAPVQNMKSYLSENISANCIGKIAPSYQPAVSLKNLNGIYPKFIDEALHEAFPYFGRKIVGFDDDDVILTGVETRSSSPVRIIRKPDSYESLTMRGLYPIGEGAGYAGGITSAAVDGLKTAEKLIEKYLNIAKI
ncbi:MAG: NAD(P)/FAD-dependent oxidoreductase [Clostridiales bacterium]|nr:NAD(P)/FAD-dependent oxidoreductase [Clostridiales bacterium]